MAKGRGRRAGGAARMRCRRGFRLSGASSAAVGRAVEGAVALLRRTCSDADEFAIVPDRLVSECLEQAALGAMQLACGPGDFAPTAVRAALHHLGGSLSCQERWTARYRPGRGALVLWRWDLPPRGRRRVEVVAVLYARFREADWIPDFDSSGADAVAFTLARAGRRRLAWACVLPARARDVARLYPKCGLP